MTGLFDRDVLLAALGTACAEPARIADLLDANGGDLLDFGDLRPLHGLARHLADLHTRGERFEAETAASAIAERTGIDRADVAGIVGDLVGHANPPAFSLFLDRLRALRFRRRLAELGARAQNGCADADLVAAVTEAVREHAPTVAADLAPLGADEIMAAAAQPVAWIVEPVFTAGGVRIISGIGKSYKTSLAIALGLRTIEAGDLAGMRSGGGLSVAFIDAENRPAVWGRKYVAVARGLGMDPAALVRDGRVFYLNRPGLRLDDPATLRRVSDLLRRACVGEVVIDSLTAVHRLDEIDAGAMRGFFCDGIFRLRDEVVAGITVLHHHRKNQGSDDPSMALRGTSDLRNVVDTHLAVTRIGDTLRLDVTAQREAPECRAIYLRTEWSPDGLRFTNAAPGDASLPKVAAAESEITAYLASLDEPAATRKAIVVALAERGYAERTIGDALATLTAGPTPTLRKTRQGMTVTYRSTEA